MNETLRGIFVGTAALSVAAVAAILLTVLRKPLGNSIARELASRLLLLGLAVQSLHFGEEFVTHFQVRFPVLLGLPAWPASFFVIFNLFWLSVWILAAIGLQKAYRLAFFPAWFFAIAAIANGIGHPVLALVAHGYFPGLVTSPLLGIIGVLLWLKLWELTGSSA